MRDTKLDRLFLRFRDKGDVRALSRVFDLTSRELLDLAAHVTRDVAQAEDLLQSTFLIAIERARQYEAGRGLMPWLVGILTREAKLWNRRAARRIEIDRLDTHETVDPSVELEARELSGAVIEALDKLPELYREVLVRHLCDAQSAGEIARELGRSPGTVRVQIHRGLELLKKSLPAGLVAGAIAGVMPRGLSAVRNEVVRHATLVARTLATTGVAGVAGTTLVGGIVVKKIVVVSAAVLFLLGLWFARERSLTGDSASSAASVVSRLEHEVVKQTSNDASMVDSSPGQRASVTNPAADVAAAEAKSALGSLRITVKWAEDGTPAADVHLDLALESEPWQTRRRLEAVTGPDGVAHLSNLEVGPCAIELDRADRGGRVEIKPGEEATFECTIPPGIDVEGLVVDAQGSPVAAAAIWFSSFHSYPGGMIVTHSGADGTFRVRAVQGGLSLGAQSPRYAPSEIVFLNPPTPIIDHKARITLELSHPGQSLSGVVRDPRGTPLAGARVNVGSALKNHYFIESGGQELKSRTLADGTMRVQPQPLKCLTDEAGRFHLDGVEVGDVPVLVWAQAASPWTGSVHIDADAPAQLDVRMPEAATLTGTIHRSDGTPAVKVYVEAMGPTLGLNSSTRTDADGSYRIEGLPLCELTVQANRQRFGDAGSASTKLDVVAGARMSWDAILSGSGQIAGRLLDEVGSPIASWAGIARHSKNFDKDIFGATDAAGRFVFKGCEDALYTIEFHPRGGDENTLPGAWRTDVRPSSDEIELRVRADTKPSARLRGRLLDSLGSPLRHANLQAYFVELKREHARALDLQDGRFELGPLPPGNYLLYVSAADYLAHHEIGQYTLAPSQIVDVGDVILEKPGHLHVRVWAPNGKAALEVRAHIKALQADGKEKGNRKEDYVEGRDDGSLDPGPLEPGDYVLIARAKGGAATRVTTRIESGQEAELDIHLPAGIARTFRFRLPEGDAVSQFVGYTVRDEANDVLVEDFISNNTREKALSVELTLSAGHYTIEARGEGHVIAQTSFSLSLGAAADEVIELVLGKKH